MNLFHFEVPMANLIFRGAFVYVSILLMLRLSGKRQLGQMSASEFVAILLISNAVQNSMNGGDNSLIGGIVLAAVLVILSTAISFLTYRSKLFSRVFEGTPTLLIHKGVPIPKHLEKERLSTTDLKILLRKQGVHHFHDVADAILEADGSLSITHVNEVTPKQI